MIKKFAALVGGAALLGITLLVPSVRAQTAQPIYVITSSEVPMTSGYIQLDGLTVASVSGAVAPAQIMAVNPGYMTQTGASTWATTTAAVNCEQFATDASVIGVNGVCPVPPVAYVNTTSTATVNTSTTASTTPSTWYSPYTINIVATTKLLLRDRTSAVLGNFRPGDTINVYGLYNANGTIDAEVVRDISKPVTGLVINNDGTTAAMSSTSNFSAEIAQLQALVAQLEASVNASGTVPVSSNCPMMTATSTGVCTESTGTTTGTVNGSGTIIY